MTLKINSIKQIRNGVQERAYADHVWKWEIDARGNGRIDQEAMLAFCQEHLRSSARSEQEYREAMANAKGFDETMKIVCGGRYSLTSDKYGVVWTYTVTEDYID